MSQCENREPLFTTSLRCFDWQTLIPDLTPRMKTHKVSPDWLHPFGVLTDCKGRCHARVNEGSKVSQAELDGDSIDPGRRLDRTPVIPRWLQKLVSNMQMSDRNGFAKWRRGLISKKIGKQKMDIRGMTPNPSKMNSIWFLICLHFDLQHNV